MKPNDWREVLEGEKQIGSITQPKPAIIWLTGLCGSGKSMLATKIVDELRVRGYGACNLDGDELRKGICSDLGFSLKDRSENVARVGEVAKLLVDAGMFAVVSLVSPILIDRAMVRDSVEENQFIEIHMNASLEYCESVDAKGNYAKARSGKLKDFTGISSSYEFPKDAELTFNIEVHDIELVCIRNIIAFLNERGNITISTGTGDNNG